MIKRSRKFVPLAMLLFGVACDEQEIEVPEAKCTTDADCCEKFGKDDPYCEVPDMSEFFIAAGMARPDVGAPDEG